MAKLVNENKDYDDTLENIVRKRLQTARGDMDEILQDYKLAQRLYSYENLNGPSNVRFWN